MNRHIEQGFTLIELMISIILALLISAAALALFFDSSRNLRIQESADDVQEASVFGLAQIESKIAMANLGSYRPMKQNTPWTGILFTGYDGTDTAGRFLGNIPGNENNTKLTVDVLTASGERLPASLGQANVTGASTRSDQLIIQYQAPFDMLTCTGDTVSKGDMVIERYFTRKDTAAAIASNEAKDSDNLSIVLACASGSYGLENGSATAKLSDNGSGKTISDAKLGINKAICYQGASGCSGNAKDTVMINRVDYFGVRLGVLRKNGIEYMKISDYMEKLKGGYKVDAPVVAVKIAVITRGLNSAGTETLNEFTVFGGDELTIKNTDNDYVRRVYEKTIKLPNNMATESVW